MSTQDTISVNWQKLAQTCNCLDIACLTPAILPPDYLPKALEDWQAQGNLGALDYIDSRADILMHPFDTRPWAQAAIVLTFAPKPDLDSPLRQLPPPVPTGPVSYIAAYALNEDYHRTGQTILQSLQLELSSMAPPGHTPQFDLCVDTKPVMEKELAILANLGVKGYNSLVRNPSNGSQIHIAIAFTSLPLTPYIPPVTPIIPCSQCGKCLARCPNHAFDTKGHFEVRKCRAWLAAEYRKPLSMQQQKLLGNTLFGCGICTETCPATQTPQTQLPINPMAILALSGNRLQTLIRNTVLDHAGATVLKRNAAANLFNQTKPDKWPEMARKLIGETHSDNLKISIQNTLNN